MPMRVRVRVSDRVSVCLSDVIRVIRVIRVTRVVRVCVRVSDRVNVCLSGFPQDRLMP